MNTRPQIVAFRVSPAERRVLDQLVQRKQQTASDMLRDLVCREAASHGILPPATKTRAGQEQRQAT